MLAKNVSRNWMEVLDDAKTEAKQAEREQCCKDVCARCRLDYSVRRQADNIEIYWKHGPSMICDASAIRERAYQEQEQDRFDREIGAASVVPSLHQQEQEGK